MDRPSNGCLCGVSVQKRKVSQRILYLTSPEHHEPQAKILTYIRKWLARGYNTSHSAYRISDLIPTTIRIHHNLFRAGHSRRRTLEIMGADSKKTRVANSKILSPSLEKLDPETFSAKTHVAVQRSFFTARIPHITRSRTSRPIRWSMRGKNIRRLNTFSSRSRQVGCWVLRGRIC